VNTYYRDLMELIGRSVDALGVAIIVIGAVVAPTLENVLILALIVLVRTFLSVALQLEVEGRWPWNRGEESPKHPS
jgi:uncharacterized membrane protein